MDGNGLRRLFTEFFTERGHTRVASAGLIPHHPRAPLFTNAGMNQFLPYILGEEAPPYPRATSVQKCVRVKGKHDDIDNIGLSTQHLSFFEMLGNFSLGDYFKDQAIPWAWELLTEGFGYEADRLWVTVHTSDDEAEAIWREAVGVPGERIQRLGDDNLWEMGETGPCGPCSELHYDKGERYGKAGGPAHGDEARFVEIWNLVFMQYNRQPDGSLVDLPRKIIDTGAGFERNLSILQGTDSVFETDVLRPIVARAEELTGRRYGEDGGADVALRILADHARTMAFLVNDGVFPSNEDRGYVLRRVIRRAVRHAYLLGVEKVVTPGLVQRVAEVMADAHPDLVANADFVSGVVSREEERFRQTLRSGLAILEGELDRGASSVEGEVAFRLHDTFGFPIDLTREIAGERGVTVDLPGFEAAMAEQRERARSSRRALSGDEGDLERYAELVGEFGPTEFRGYVEHETTSRVLAVLDRTDGSVEVFLDRTPFYAEAGGQVGDTGTITTETGVARVLDTTFAVPGFPRHQARVVEGEVGPGQEASAVIDHERREAIRRNHTGTHLLHWALREVLGPHVKQHGSLVAPDRLRFDFSHYSPVSPDELAKVETLATERVLANDPVRAYETSREEATSIGAIAFFGEKYGDIVRVIEANGSVELCGGTHVSALGMIGPIKVVSEASIGANLRRIEALTGAAAFERIRHEEAVLQRAAVALRVKPDEVAERVERELEQRRALEREVEVLRKQAAGGSAQALATEASDGAVVARRDGLAPSELRELAVAVRDQPGVRAVVLGGSPPKGGASMVAAVARGSGLVASDLIAEAVQTIGGGGKRNPDVAVAGGRDASRLDEALDQVRAGLRSTG